MKNTLCLLSAIALSPIANAGLINHGGSASVFIEVDASPAHFSDSQSSTDPFFASWFGEVQGSVAFIVGDEYAASASAHVTNTTEFDPLGIQSHGVLRYLTGEHGEAIARSNFSFTFETTSLYSYVLDASSDTDQGEYSSSGLTLSGNIEGVIHDLRGPFSTQKTGVLFPGHIYTIGYGIVADAVDFGPPEDRPAWDVRLQLVPDSTPTLALLAVGLVGVRLAKRK